MLTASQSKTYQFIQDYIRKNRFSPTMAEIAKGIGIQSRGVVYRYVQALAEKGLIKMLPNRRRNIQLLVRTSSKWVLPLLGHIKSASPLEVSDDQEGVDIAKLLLGSNHYAFRVVGDSMQDEGIFDGDLIICKPSDTALDGQLVVVLIDNQVTTLKHIYYNEDETITLRSAHLASSPLIYFKDQIKIHGIFVGLVRQRYG